MMNENRKKPFEQIVMEQLTRNYYTQMNKNDIFSTQEIDELVYKTVKLRMEIVTIDDRTLEGQKRLQEILIELNKLDEELLIKLGNSIQDNVKESDIP